MYTSSPEVVGSCSFISMPFSATHQNEATGLSKHPRGLLEISTSMLNCAVGWFPRSLPMALSSQVDEEWETRYALPLSRALNLLDSSDDGSYL